MIRELVFACRVGGKPKADVVWQFNNVEIQQASEIDLLNETSFSILNFPNGRSALTINVEENSDILRGQNEIVCTAENAGGSTTGSFTIEGICTYLNQHTFHFFLSPLLSLLLHTSWDRGLLINMWCW